LGYVRHRLDDRVRYVEVRLSDGCEARFEVGLDSVALEWFRQGMPQVQPQFAAELRRRQRENEVMVRERRLERFLRENPVSSVQAARLRELMERGMGQFEGALREFGRAMEGAGEAFAQLARSGAVGGQVYQDPVMEICRIADGMLAENERARPVQAPLPELPPLPLPRAVTTHGLPADDPLAVALIRAGAPGQTGANAGRDEEDVL
jgi:hypothetical protein